MDDELARLQAALLRGKKASAELPIMESDYTRAQSRADAAQPQINEYGTVSPLAILANTVGRSRGRRDERLLKPRLQKAYSTIGDSEAASEGNTLRMAMGKEQREVETHQQDISNSVLRRTLATNKDLREAEEASRKQEAHRFLLETNKGKGENWTDGTDTEVVIYDPRGRPVFAHNGEAVPEGWTIVEPTYGAGGGKTISPYHIDTLTQQGNQVKKVQRVVDTFKPSYIQPTGFGTETLNKLLVDASRADILKYADDPKLDANAKEAMLWWADWKMTYELLERHKLFGATLTNNEMASWKEATGLLLGMDPAKAQERINILFSDLQQDLAGKGGALRLLRQGNANEEAALDRVLSIAGATYDPEAMNYTYAPRDGSGEVADFEITPQVYTDLLNTLEPSEREDFAKRFDALGPGYQRELARDILGL